MDELALLARMREEVPQGTPYPAALRALMAEISGPSPAPSPSLRDRLALPRRILIGGVLAGAVAAGAVLAPAVVDSGDLDRTRRGPVTAPTAPALRLVAVTSPMTLATNAAAVASRAPVPAPTQWVYVKLRTTTSHAPPSGVQVQNPGSYEIREGWTRVDLRFVAEVRQGKVVVSGSQFGESTPIGWPYGKVTHSYLNSLPTDPDRLLATIRHNTSIPTPARTKGTDDDVFDAVMALMESYTVLPPRLNAALYGVLARLKVVHLERVRDNAGRKVLGLYRIKDGTKESILIDPVDYRYVGQKRIMVADHSSRGDDGALNLNKGDLLADEAILVSKIVNTAGARS